jgi:hypothetical protein
VNKRYKRFLEGGFLYFFPPPYDGENIENKNREERKIKF